MSSNRIIDLLNIAKNACTDFYEVNGTRLRRYSKLPYLYKFREHCSKMANENKLTQEETLEFQQLMFDQLIKDDVLVPIKRYHKHKPKNSNQNYNSASSVSDLSFQEVQNIYKDIFNHVEKLKIISQQFTEPPFAALASYMYKEAKENFDTMFDQAVNDEERLTAATLVKEQIVAYITALSDKLSIQDTETAAPEFKSISRP